MATFAVTNFSFKKINKMDLLELGKDLWVWGGDPLNFWTYQISKTSRTSKNPDNFETNPDFDIFSVKTNETDSRHQNTRRSNECQ